MARRAAVDRDEADRRRLARHRHRQAGVHELGALERRRVLVDDRDRARLVAVRRARRSPAAAPPRPRARASRRSASRRRRGSRRSPRRLPGSRRRPRACARAPRRGRSTRRARRGTGCAGPLPARARAPPRARAPSPPCACSSRRRARAPAAARRSPRRRERTSTTSSTSASTAAAAPTATSAVVAVTASAIISLVKTSALPGSRSFAEPTHCNRVPGRRLWIPNDKSARSDSHDRVAKGRRIRAAKRIRPFDAGGPASLPCSSGWQGPDPWPAFVVSAPI